MSRLQAHLKKFNIPMEFKQELTDLQEKLLEFTETDEVASLRKVIALCLEFYDQMTDVRKKEFYAEIRNNYCAILKLRE